MTLLKLAAFSDAHQGGNPAGVFIDTQLPAAADMQKIAADIAFSETAFAAREGNGWRVRYFSPEVEVPFCGHATIALGAALAMHHGDGEFALQLNEANITVSGVQQGELFSASLLSPPTHSRVAPEELVRAALDVFSYSSDDLDKKFTPALGNGGANHLLLMLNSRAALAAMHYSLTKGRQLMLDNQLLTVLFGWAESTQCFHTRNAFASGGIYEDPATGAATAALAGYLRDINWPTGGMLDVIQGEDMGMCSLLRAEYSTATGSAIRVSGQVRRL